MDKKANDAPLSREERALARSESVQLSRQWGPGGTYRQILMAVSAGAGGNVSGGVGQFAQAAAVNYLQALGAEQVKLFADSLGGGTQAEAARSALHAIVGCAGAAANGSGSCGAGALGAGASSVLNALLSQSNSDSLSPQEKEAHGNLISSLVGAIGLGLGTDAVTAVVSARTETENNYLNVGEVRRMMEDLQGCRSAGDGDACRDEVKERYLALSKANGGSGLYGCKAEGESACNAQYSEVQEGNQLLEVLERLGWSGAEYAVLDDLLELNWNDERIADGAWRQSWYQDAGVPVSVGIGVVAGAGIRAEAAAAKGSVMAIDTAPMAQRVLAVRAGLPSNLKRSGNVAVAEIDIPGVPGKMAAHSQVSDSGRGLIGSGSGNFLAQSLPNKAGDIVYRGVDTEYKILDNIADRLQGNSAAKGVVNIFTEKAACASCLNVAEQFKAKYPNIEVNIFDNNGVMLRPPRRVP